MTIPMVLKLKKVILDKGEKLQIYGGYRNGFGDRFGDVDCTILTDKDDSSDFTKTGTVERKLCNIRDRLIAHGYRS